MCKRNLDKNSKILIVKEIKKASTSLLYFMDAILTKPFLTKSDEEVLEKIKKLNEDCLNIRGEF